MDLRRIPLAQQVIAGASALVLVLAVATLLVRGGGGGRTPSAAPSPTVVASSAAPTPTATTPPPPLAVAARPKLLHALKATAPVPGNVAGAVTGLLGRSGLGPGVVLDVVDVRSGQPLYQTGAGTLVPPASTAKLLVAAAALRVLGPTATLATTVVRGAKAGQVVLVGGGDPTLSGLSPDGPGSYPSDASLATLAAQTAKAVHKGPVTVGYDSTLYGGPATAEGWKPIYVTEGDVAPVSALEVDSGRQPDPNPGHDTPPVPRSQDPALAAAQEFVTYLKKDGVTVTGTPAAAPAPAGKPLAKVVSAPLSALVERMLRISDNDIAESLARQVALKEHQPPTFTGAAAGVAQALVPLGVDPATLHMVDGSGLSTNDTVQVGSLITVLRAATSSAPLRPLLTGLPVAGFLGTLSTRYTTTDTAVGIGAVRAKTGTLTHVSSLAGLVTDTSGRLLAFAAVAPAVPSLSPAIAEADLDRIASALAGCGCS